MIMADYMMGNELDDDLGDFDAGASTNSDNDKVDSILIKKILSEMKSEFNRNVPYGMKDDSEDQLSSANLTASLDTTFPSENGHESEQEDNKNESKDLMESVPDEKEKTPPPEESLPASESNEEPIDDTRENSPNGEESDSVSNLDSIASEKSSEVIDPPKKKVKISKDNNKSIASPESQVLEDNSSSAERKSRRSMRNIEKQDPEVGLKRSSRRMSKEYSRESVLQNAIARKEKSFSSLISSEEKHRRSSRLSEDKSVSKYRATRSSLKGSNEDLPTTKVYNENSKTNGKLAKSPNLSGSDANDVENDSPDVSTSSTPKKVPKVQLENGFEEDLSNNTPNNLQSEIEWEKGTDSSSNFSSGSVKAKKKTFSFANESYQPPAKKAKPNNSAAAEMNDVTSRDTFHPRMSWSKSNCECQTDEGLYPSKTTLPSPSYCRALDSFENRIIGCCNLVDENTPLLRPSRTIPLLLMCDLHIGRLVRHNCCPTCGLFCTQGIFNQCRDLHFFHKDCELKKEDDLLFCPHCGSDDFCEVKLSMGAHQYPVFLPMQKLPNKYPLARISISRTSYTDLEKKDENEINELIPEKDLLFNKKKFSTEGLPPMEKLEKLMHAFSSKNDLPLRFSSRAFYQACKHGDTEKVLSMIGGNVKESCSLMPLHAAAGNGHLLIVHILVQCGLALEALDKSQYTPLMLAALNGHNSVVKYLVKAGADVAFKGSDGMTALHLAAKVGNLEACHYLLSAANKPLAYVDTIDDGRWTPLVWAAENKHTDIVRYLLEKKADPQIRDSEMNIALHWSAFSGSMEITEDLLNYGSDINLSNAHGDTPLHIAARQGADNCVMLLLARGALTDVKNKAGQLPTDCVLPDYMYCKVAIELNMKVNKGHISKPLSYPKIICNDISRGHELNPIQVINNIDDDPVPSDFTYITENCVTSNLSIDRRITTLTGCKCEDTCTTGSCMCSRISLRSWYDSRGKLLPEFNFEDPPMIFECNQTCECNALACKNRVVQRGLKVKLQICKTKNKNWGVITLREIPKGTYVCEYIGEIISDCEADTREDDSYLFDLDNRDGESYCIDACKYGNVTRFVNHSCKPNLVPVRIFVGHHDLHFPRIAFFAARDIAPNEELGFDYGEKFWVIKYKKFTCSCEELNCRYSSTTIYDTLEKYKEKLKIEESL